MKAYILNKGDIFPFLDLIRKDYEVVAPFVDRYNDSYYDYVTDRNIKSVQLHFANPLYPPKQFVFPGIESMFCFDISAKEVKIFPTWVEKPIAIFGIRSCDVAAISHLDRFFLHNGFVDPYYLRRRRNLFLINIVCTQIDTDITENCFCLCSDTGPSASLGFDLQLIDLGEEWMLIGGSQKGQKYLEAPFLKEATQLHFERRHSILSWVRHNFPRQTTSWFAATIRFISQDKVIEEIWEEIGDRCLECGGCSYVCPTCSCFTVTDLKYTDTQFTRIRVWDSCALQGFTRMAGGFNPRKSVHDRRNRRFFHKLAYHFIQRDFSIGCVGCGRCEKVCHGGIGMPTVVEKIRRATVKKLNAT